MIAYYFRVMTDGQPNGYMGLVFAQNKSDLFWQIDEFVDPYAVEVQKAYIGGYCKLLTKISEEDIKTSKHEYSEREPFFEEEKWKTMNWDGVLPWGT